MENKAALRAKGENRMLQKSQEEPKKKNKEFRTYIHTFFRNLMMARKA